MYCSEESPDLPFDSPLLPKGGDAPFNKCAHHNIL